MGTVVVWLLIVSTGGYHSEGSIAFVDNIASQQNCEALRSVVTPHARAVAYTVTSQCVAVRKARR